MLRHKGPFHSRRHNGRLDLNLLLLRSDFRSTAQKQRTSCIVRRDEKRRMMFANHLKQRVSNMSSRTGESILHQRIVPVLSPENRGLVNAHFAFSTDSRDLITRIQTSHRELTAFLDSHRLTSLLQDNYMTWSPYTIYYVYRWKHRLSPA